MRRSATGLLLLLIMLGAVPVYAQGQTGQIQGQVNDANGLPLPGAMVSISGLGLSTITNVNGNYLFSSVPVGTYTMQASLTGLPGQEITGAYVQAAQTLTVNFFIGAPPQLTMTRPAGGETWTVGTTESIRWMGRDVNSTVELFLVDPATGQGTSIISSTADDGEYAWRIPGTVSSGLYTILVRSTQNVQLNAISSTFTIQGAAQPPVVRNPGPQQNDDGESVSLQIQATDPGGGALTYSAVGLPPGLAIGATTGLINGTINNDASGNSPYNVRVTAVNPQNLQASVSFQWTVTNPPPVAVDDNYSVQENTLLTVAAAQGVLANDTDPDGDMLTARLVSGGNNGTVNLALDGSFTYQPNTNFSGTDRFTYAADDGWANPVPATVTITVVPSGNPVLTNPGNQNNAEGDVIALQVQATDPAGETLTFDASNLPGGLSIDAATGLISGTITNDASDDSPYSVDLSVTNSSGSQVTARFRWTVFNPAPAMTNPGAQDNDDGEAIALQVQATDPDGDALTYDATGLPGGLSIDAATGEVGGMIASDASDDSPYTVTVWVVDSQGRSENVDFTWRVTNPAPVVRAIDPQTSNEGDAVSLQVRATDDDMLRYAASGLPDGLSIEATTGLISGMLAPGTASSLPYDVTLTVTDAQDAASSVSFNWTVQPATNTQPSLAVVRPNGGEVWMPGTEEAIQWTSSNVVGEVEIELLRNGNLERVLAANTTNDGIHTWMIPSDLPEDGTYRIRINNLGSPAVSDESDADFAIQAGGVPAVTVVEEAPPERAQALNLIVSTSLAQFTPTQRDLFYRRGGERDYQHLNLSTTGEGLAGVIPPAYVTERGVDYYVHLSDGDMTFTFPAEDPEANPAHRQVYVARMVPDGDFLAETYRMMTIPLVRNGTGAASVFGDDYGAADPAQWRFLQWNNSAEAYDEAGEGALTPGHAFWLISRSGEAFDVEDAYSVDASQPYALSVAPGWNQVANPFAFSVAWRDIVNRTLVEAPVRYEASGSGQDPYQYAQEVLEPWEGYWVYNPGAAAVSLSVLPVEGSAGKGGPSNRALTRSSYTVQLIARLPGRGLQDAHNYLGFADDASEGRDRLDFAEAPGIGPHVRLSIMERGEPLAGSFKPAQGSGQRWDLEVSATVPEEGQTVRESVVVTLHEQGTLPEGFTRYVLDLDYGSLIPLVGNTFSVATGEAFPVRHLSVLIGTPAFAGAQREGIPLVPIDYALSQNYPNPFNPETRIRFQVSRQEHVVLAVYNVLGQHVRTLIDGVCGAGSHEVAWDGYDAAGDAVGSGVYFYRMTAGSFTASKKMLLMR